MWVVGDAPGHGWNGANDGWPQGCPCGRTVESVAQEVREAGVRVDVLCLRGDPEAQRFFQALAKACQGVYHEGSVGVESVVGVLLPGLRQVAKALADPTQHGKEMR